MNSRIVLLLLALLAVCCFVSADVGLSPSFSFTIEAGGLPSGYKLFYAGNIWSEKLEEVSNETNVYKLNTHITVYGVPESADIENFNETAAQSIKSQVFSLNSGHTVFSLSEINKTAKTMKLVEKSNTSGGNSDGLLSNPLLFVAGLGVIVLLVLFFKRKKKD